MAHANTSLDCCVRATSTEAQMRDNSVLTLGVGPPSAPQCPARPLPHAPSRGFPDLRFPPPPSFPAKAGYPVRRSFSVQSLLPLEYWITRPSAQLRTRRVMTVLCGGLRQRTLLGPVAPAGGARVRRCKTQYKCGKSRVRNNHPLGKPGYDQRLLLAPALLLSLE